MEAGGGFLPSNSLPFFSSAFSFLGAPFDWQNSKLLYTCQQKPEASTCRSLTLANRSVQPQGLLLQLPCSLPLDHTLSMGRIWICCTFNKLIEQLPQESKLSAYSAFPERSWQWCQHLFIPPIAAALCINPGQTALPRPRTSMGVPSPPSSQEGDPGKPLQHLQQPQRKGQQQHHCSEAPGGWPRAEGEGFLWCPVPETSFFHSRKMQILKKGARLRLILLCQWQPTVWQSTGIQCPTQLSCFDCICHTLVDLQVEGDDELLVFLSHSSTLYASAGMNLSTQMQNEWMAFNHFDNVNVIALTE